MSEKECPRCGKPMEFQEGEDDVGLVAGWECPGCGHTELDDLSQYEIDE